jgi:hypothetical protein
MSFARSGPASELTIYRGKYQMPYVIRQKRPQVSSRYRASRAGETEGRLGSLSLYQR